jgi:hypothetical protein
MDTPHLKTLVGLSIVISGVLTGCIHSPQNDSTPSGTALPTITSAGGLESGTILIQKSQGLWLLDPSRQSAALYAALTNQEETLISTPKISSDGRYIYALLGPSSVGGVKRNELYQLIQIDTRTKEERTLFEYPGLFTIVAISPNGQKIILDYFAEGGYYPVFCVFDITQEDCKHSEFSLDWRQTHWINDSQFVAIAAGSIELYLVDATTLATERIYLPAPIYAFDLLQSRQVLTFKGHGNRPAMFYTIGLDTQQYQFLPYSTISNYYALLNELQLSPNEKYLLYDHSENYVVIDFISGETIGEIDEVFSAEWLPDSQGIIFMRCPDGNCGEVSLFDLTSRSLDVLYRDDELESVIVVP